MKKIILNQIKVLRAKLWAMICRQYRQVFGDEIRSSESLARLKFLNEYTILIVAMVIRITIMIISVALIWKYIYYFMPTGINNSPAWPTSPSHGALGLIIRPSYSIIPAIPRNKLLQENPLLALLYPSSIFSPSPQALECASAQEQELSVSLMPAKAKGTLELDITQISWDEDLSTLEIMMFNTKILEGRKFFIAFYNTLYSCEDWLNYSQNKIIFSEIRFDNGQYMSPHRNTVVNNFMTLKEFEDALSPFAKTSSSSRYQSDVFESILVRSWNINMPKNNTVKRAPIFGIGSNHMAIGQFSPMPSAIPHGLGSGLLGVRPYSTKAQTPAIPASVPAGLPAGAGFSTFDIETIKYPTGVVPNGQGNQLPVSISIKSPDKEVKLFICLDPQVEDSQLEMWHSAMLFLCSNLAQGALGPGPHVVWVHNLNFDGVFIYKYLNLLKTMPQGQTLTPGLKHFWVSSRLEPIMDNANRFVAIKFIIPSLALTLIFKDSFRVFPVSLKDLTSIFSSDSRGLAHGQAHGQAALVKDQSYDVIYNDLTWLKNNAFCPSPTEAGQKFIDYAKLDATSLHRAISNAQAIYLKEYGVDLNSVYSTSTLSYKIFKTKFDPALPKKDKKEIIMPMPLSKHMTNGQSGNFTSRSKINKTLRPAVGFVSPLKKSQDIFLRPSYHGGSTDLYQKYGENLYYYDVNSLYPWAMTQPMPIKIKEWHEIITPSIWDEFFGFCYAKITVPKDVKAPLLPYTPPQDHELAGHIIYPTGTFTGIYFSEELKSCERKGYTIEPLHGYSFKKGNVFNDYVNHFYEIKSLEKGPKREIAKLCLNTLYGFYGRSMQTLNTLEVENKLMPILQYVLNIKALTKLSKEKSILLVEDGINHKLLASTNMTLVGKFKEVDRSFTMPSKANVAIASAITAYARTFMHKFKDSHTFYSDTDSIFTSKPLDEVFLGNGLGQFKNELQGKSATGIIEKAYFLGPKQYAYQYKDIEGSLITKSIWAGVKRDSLTWSQIMALAEEETVTIERKNVFQTDRKNYNITIKDMPATLTASPNKILINNIYQPPRV